MRWFWAYINWVDRDITYKNDVWDFEQAEHHPLPDPYSWSSCVAVVPLPVFLAIAGWFELSEQADYQLRMLTVALIVILLAIWVWRFVLAYWRHFASKRESVNNG